MTSAFANYTELEIIDAVKNGNTPLYEIIVRRYNPVLYKVGRSYNFNHQDTEDVMQDTYIDAFKNLKSFEYRSNFKTWIIRIMLNNCYRKKNKASFKIETIQDQIKENQIPMFNSNNMDTSKQYHHNELGKIIEHSLASIAEDYRLVFSLREISGLNVAETSEILNISEANVKVKLNRAKKMLRNEIEKSYAKEDLFEFNLKYCNPFTEKVMMKIMQL